MAEHAQSEAGPDLAPTPEAPKPDGLVPSAAGLGMVGVPSGRGGGVALARRMIALQRAAGNTATRRMVARQGDHFQWTYPPAGTPAEQAAWLAKRYPSRLTPGTHIVAIPVDGRVEVFSAEAEPVPLGTFKLGEQSLDPGIWAGFSTFSGPMGRMNDSDFMYAGGNRMSVAKLVHEVDELAWSKLIPKTPGEVWLLVPAAGPAPTKPVEEAQPSQRWAYEQVERAQKLLDAPQPTDKGPKPDRLVPYPDGPDWQLNVWRKGDHRTLKLDPKETDQNLQRRIRDATRVMEIDDDPARSVRVQGTRDAPPQIDQQRKAGELAPPPGINPTGGLKTNSPAFPARLVSHGPEGRAGRQFFEHTVSGADVNFTMDLDFAAVTSGFWEEFGARWQTIAYRWELFDLSSVKLSQFKAALQKAGGTDPKADVDAASGSLPATGEETESGIVGGMSRDLSNTWEDTANDLSDPAVWLSAPFSFSLIAISDLVQVIGAPVSAFFSLVSSPMSDRSIRFSREGMFLLRCFAQPVITPSDIERIESKGGSPIIRPPSVAYIPVKVTPINKRAQEVNDAELTAIAELKKRRDETTETLDRQDIEAQLKEAEAGLGDNSVEAIDRVIRGMKAQLTQVATWRDAEHKNVALESRDPALRAWKAKLDISGVSFAAFEQRLQDDIGRLEAARKRVAGYGLDGIAGKAFRPRVTLVSEVDGGVYPLVTHLAEDGTSKEGRRVWRLADISTEDNKRIYTGSGSTHNDAINAAFEKFKEGCEYGRGTIAIRLPLEALRAATGEDISVPSQLRAAPGREGRFLQRLKDLATAAEVTAMFVGGPIGVAIGVVGGIAGGAVAIHSLAERASRGKSFLTFEAGMDIIGVVGAVAGLGGAAARIKGVAKLSSRAKWIGDKLHIVGMGMMKGQVIIIPTALYVELGAIDRQEAKEIAAAEQSGTVANVDRSKYQARRLEALAKAVKSGVVTIRTMQMASDPELGWNPLKGKAGQPPPPPDPEAPTKALTAKLKELAQLLKKPGASNTERQQVIEALRTPHEAARGPLEGYVPQATLRENQQAVRKVRDRLVASNPDVIVGMERGGSFLADVLAHGNPDIAGKVRKMPVVKATPDASGKAPKSKFDPVMASKFEALVDAGAKKIALVDYYMGGRTAGDLSKLLRDHFTSNPKFQGVTIEVIWIRESFGLTEAGGTTLGPLRGTPGAAQKGAAMYSQSSEVVTLALGDDMTSVLTPGSEAPISVFNDAGSVVKTVHPSPGQSTRDVMIGLLNGSD